MTSKNKFRYRAETMKGDYFIFAPVFVGELAAYYYYNLCPEAKKVLLNFLKLEANALRAQYKASQEDLEKCFSVMRVLECDTRYRHKRRMIDGFPECVTDEIADDIAKHKINMNPMNFVLTVLIECYLTLVNKGEYALEHVRAHKWMVKMWFFTKLIEGIDF
jgi:hypothetical protein